MSFDWQRLRYMFEGRSYLLNLLLFILTVLTTTTVGALFYVNDPSGSLFSRWLNGYQFSLPLMTILLVHEMGHFIAGRYYHLDVTLPYFIPAIPPLGTFGAIIKIKSPIPTLPALVRVGAAGPLAGAAAAIPLLAVGLHYSQVLPLQTDTGPAMTFGSSLLFEALSWLTLGVFSSQATIILHPMALAAWFGLFVTSMNLLPIGQLDGGHVACALFGRSVGHVVATITLAALMILGLSLWPGWLFFGLLTLFLGTKHPPTLDEEVRLDSVGYVLGWLAVILFVISFTPVPIGGVALSDLGN